MIARPKNAQSSFESGSAEPIAIPLSATADSVIDLTKSYIEFKVELIDSAGNILVPANVPEFSQLDNLDTTKLLSAKVGIAQYTAPTPGAPPTINATTCKYAYFHNSGCLFSKINVKELQSNSIIQEIDNLGLLSAAQLAGQPHDTFWGEDSLHKCDDYLAGVKNFVPAWPLCRSN